MESLLLTFYNLNLKEFSQKEVSQKLGVSQKHLSRCLARWSHEGILSYRSGIGRGNPSTLTWHKDIDTLYFNIVSHAFQTEDIAECIPYLTWDFSPEKKQQLLLTANQLLGVHTSQNDKLVIRKRYAPITLNPLKVTDINSFNILKNIYDSLVSYKEGQFHPKLARQIEMYEKYADVYLRKQIYFHDGSLLTASDVIYSLEKARQDHNIRELLSPVKYLEYIHDYHFKIHYEYFPHLLDVLSTLNMSIFKETSDKIIGTGPFYIDKNSTAQTTLKAFDKYYGYSPYLDEVELLYIPAIKTNEFRINKDEKNMIYNITDGFYYTLKLKNNVLTHQQQQTIHYLLQRFKDYTARDNISNIEVKLLSYSNYRKEHLNELSSHFSLTIVYPSYIHKLMCEIKDYLASYNITLQLLPIDIEEALTSTLDYNADYYIHGAFLNGSERYEYFSFIFQNASTLFHVNHHVKQMNGLKEYYMTRPIEDWNRINRLVDRYLDRHCILFPIFHNKKEVEIPAQVQAAEIVLHGFYNWNEIYIK